MPVKTADINMHFKSTYRLVYKYYYCYYFKKMNITTIVIQKMNYLIKKKGICKLSHILNDHHNINIRNKYNCIKFKWVRTTNKLYIYVLIGIDLNIITMERYVHSLMQQRLVSRYQIYIDEHVKVDMTLMS